MEHIVTTSVLCQVSLVPSLLDTREKRGSLVSEVTWQTLIKWRYATVSAKHWFQTYLTSLVNKTWLSEPYKNRSTLADARVAFLLTRIEPEGSKVVLTHAQFSRSATLPTLYIYGHTSVTWFWIPGSASFLACVEKIGEAGDEASAKLNCIEKKGQHDIVFINTNSKQEFCVLVDIEDVKLVVKHDRESAQWELFITQRRMIRIYGQEGMCVNWNNNCIHSVSAIARDHKLSTFEIAHVERVQWQSPWPPSARSQREGEQRSWPVKMAFLRPAQDGLRNAIFTQR